MFAIIISTLDVQGLGDNLPELAKASLEEPSLFIYVW
jgi:hypothetical protein